MPEVFCNTSPFQYLHQLGLLHVLPNLLGRVIVPYAVEKELAVGKATGIDLPDLATFGLLLDAKRAGLVSSIRPLLDQLQALRFRVSERTREAVLVKAGE